LKVALQAGNPLTFQIMTKGENDYGQFQQPDQHPQAREAMAPFTIKQVECIHLQRPKAKLKGLPSASRRQQAPFLDT
jgi:hypothetical protein